MKNRLMSASYDHGSYDCFGWPTRFCFSFVSIFCVYCCNPFWLQCSPIIAYKSNFGTSRNILRQERLIFVTSFWFYTNDLLLSNRDQWLCWWKTSSLRPREWSLPNPCGNKPTGECCLSMQPVVYFWNSNIYCEYMWKAWPTRKKEVNTIQFSMNELATIKTR